MLEKTKLFMLTEFKRKLHMRLTTRLFLLCIISHFK